MDSMNSPKDNKIERLEAELNETKMQSLADLGQAQEALEAKEKAETRSAALRIALEEMATSYLNECPKGYYRYCQGVMKGTKDES
jgi:hypothetical protein